MKQTDEAFEIIEKANAPFDKDAWAKSKQAERSELYALLDTETDRVCSDGENFKSYLDLKARLSRYSASNALLIHAQKPDAKRLADFEAWKEAGAYVKRGEKGILILERDNQYTRKDGTVGNSVKIKKLFDISQTNMAEPNEPKASVDMKKLLKALINKPPVPIRISDELEDGMGAVYDHDSKVISVRRGMEIEDIFKCISNELAHAHQAEGKEDYSRTDSAFLAYCVSYMLSKRSGIDVSSYSFNDLPLTIQDGTPKEKRAVLNEIQEVYFKIADGMNRALKAREQGKER